MNQSILNLRGKITMTDIAMMIFLYQRPRSAVELCEFLGLRINAHAAYVQRMRAKGLVKNTDRSKPAVYMLTDEGEKLVEDIRDSIEKES